MIRLFETIYPDFTWQKRTSEKVIYLTFDDGPIPEVTPWVLDQLKKYNAKATFFCVGDNIRKHQDVLQQVIDNGHAVGNHTFNHINGWKTSIDLYLENFLHFENQTPSRLFRPPYGRIKKKQAREILKTHEIIMWSVLTRDYSNKITPEKCLENAINKTRNGSIVLFHDSLKAQKNLMFTLPLFLKHFTELGYKFEKL